MFSTIRLQHFRSYTDYTAKLSPGVTIVVGPNGSGKTNLLEALYVLCVGGSFRAGDRDTVQRGQNWFRLDGQWGDKERTLTYQQTADQAEKQFVIDGAKKARLSHALRLPVVLFEPDHLRLLRAAPSARREYMDGLLGKLQPDFTWLKHQFERVLLQRNNILKQRLPRSARDDQLFVWDIKFAELAEQIVVRRRGLIELINNQLSDLYSHIARQKTAALISYVSAVPPTDYRAALLKLLSAQAERDQLRGFTGAGPQRDDFTAWLGNKPASVTASRGEMRSMLLGLKMIELRALAQQNDASPLLLLDDVFSELDAARRHSLAELAGDYQTFITTTDADAILQHFSGDYSVIATQLTKGLV